jgi:hypothetical protein
LQLPNEAVFQGVHDRLAGELVDDVDRLEVQSWVHLDVVAPDEVIHPTLCSEGIEHVSYIREVVRAGRRGRIRPREFCWAAPGRHSHRSGLIAGPIAGRECYVWRQVATGMVSIRLILRELETEVGWH